MLITGTLVGSAVALVGGMAAIGVSVGSFAGIYAKGGLWDALVNGRLSVSIGKIMLPDGQVVDVQRRHARMSALERGADGGPLQLRLESVSGTHVLVGDDARKAAARLLPTVNRFGGSRVQVQDAVSLLEAIGDPRRVLTSVQQRVGATTSDVRWGNGKRDWKGNDKRSAVKKLPGTLRTLTPRDRLALEMALHEESERRAMDGELAALELAWAEAEQIAKIADDMFLPASMNDRLDQLRDR